MNEFELIRHYFARGHVTRADTVVGIGDDAALVQAPAQHEIVVTTDTLIGGVHFPDNAHPRDIGYKALAVNLSDLAAMGATPAWFTLALSLPRVDETWLKEFSAGLFELAQEFNVELIGGDTTCGALSITITAMGIVPQGQALRRSGARVGDRIWVTGFLGDAALGLAVSQGKLALPKEYRATVATKLNRPRPRIEVALKLRGLASSCIDISDGLIADLGHVLTASGVGATLELNRLPLSPAYKTVFAAIGWDSALAHGDDYELCFTVAPEQEHAFNRVMSQLNCSFSCIGTIESAPGLRIRDQAGSAYTPTHRGYDHFPSAS